MAPVRRAEMIAGGDSTSLFEKCQSETELDGEPRIRRLPVLPHQVQAKKVEPQFCGPALDFHPRSPPTIFPVPDAAVPGQADVNQSNGLARGVAVGSCDPGGAKCEIRAEALTTRLGHGLSDLRAHGSMLLQEVRRYTQNSCFNA